jgi:ribonuclease P protein component
MAGFRPHERIRRHADFQRVYQQGVRINGRFATLFLLCTGEASGRLGVAATRKLGGAVRRNRAKRLIREIFRRHKVASGYDLVVVPKRDLLDAELTAIETEYRRNLDRGLRQARRPS